jgi:hypothetical protein
LKAEAVRLKRELSLKFNITRNGALAAREREAHEVEANVSRAEN